MQYDYKTMSPDLFEQMFKMSLFDFHTSKNMLSPLAYGCVDDDDTLVNSFPDCNNPFTQFVDRLLMVCHNFMTNFFTLV